MPRRQFKSLFCAQFGCSAAEYEEWAFQKCLYWHAKLLAPLIRKFSRSFFAEDFNFIGSLGLAEDAWQAAVDASVFHDQNHWNGGFLRTRLKIRISGRKATRLARELFSQVGQSEPERAMLQVD